MGWAGRGRRYAGLAYPALRGANQLMNASGVLAAYEAIRGKLPVTAQAVRTGLSMVELPGASRSFPASLRWCWMWRTTRIRWRRSRRISMPWATPDHACRIRRHGRQGLEPMLTKVGPLVDRWYFTDLPTPRADSAENLKAKLQQLQAQGVIRKDVSMQTFANPQQALDAAVAATEAADRIVVFGSFFTVGGVLQNGTPRLNAKHLAH
jgi:dihydrofolate synthase/folylpolyglutamate synthase